MSEDRPPKESRQGEPGFRFTTERDKAWEKINDTRIEFAKLHYDWLKHLTTLCTGSILAVSALSGSVFADTSLLLRWLIPVSLVLLLLAVLLLVFSMWYLLNRSEKIGVFWYLDADEGHEVSENLQQIQEVTAQQDLIYNRLGLTGSICFVLGVVSFCAFALRNAGTFF